MTDRTTQKRKKKMKKKENTRYISQSLGNDTKMEKVIVNMPISLLKKIIGAANEKGMTPSKIICKILTEHL